ncbi:MAG: nickel pincer cofactor biosynthesis protein LarB [Myxococcales bacterium]|nr:nickel pincer cofactor biosynthesis protein LarB [Myxococcales bacterium]
MDRQQLLDLLRGVEERRVTVEAAVERLRELPFQEVPHQGGATLVDHHRELRTGIPEVVFGEAKTATQIAQILVALARLGNGALATRVTPDKAALVLGQVPEAEYLEVARVVRIAPQAPRPAAAPVGVICAGTSDLPVAEEAAATCQFLGAPVLSLSDVGVAGVHRLLARLPELEGVGVLVVVAGMEGALPTAVAGLARVPVIAVPTSVGYGVGFGGLVALASMLTSCAPGITTVNIDNGFGAAVAAVRIARLAHLAQAEPRS